MACPLLCALLVCALGAACAPDSPGPSILLITLDTTRRDHLGMYGYEIPTSPHLDRLAADSVVYTNAYAVSSWTLPTHASMFTGKLPTAHGARYDAEGPLKLSDGIEGGFDHYRARPLAEGETTLAEVLAEHGYATAGIIAGPWMKAAFRLGKGFEHYDDDGVTAVNGRPAKEVTDAAIGWLDAHGDERFFLFLNYYDPHGPWFENAPVDAEGRPQGPPKPFQDVGPVMPPGIDPARLGSTEFARICYDAEIRAMDAEIGRLLQHLRSRGLYEDAWIFVLSDHGELMGDPFLGETGLWGHGDSLSQAEIHIPFVIKEPGVERRVGLDARPVLQTNILPTILERLELPIPPDVQGAPLGEALPIVAELRKLPRPKGAAPKDWRHLGDWRVLVDGKDKLGLSSNGTHFLVDLEQDPVERTNVYEKDQELAKRLQRRLEGYLQRLPRPGATGEVEQPGAEELEALRGLGYL